MKRKSLNKYQLIVAAILAFQVQFVFAEQLAFPGAEGFGAYAKGGRGGDVYYVTNLNDSGSGSLRYAIDSANGPRSIVFAVSGLIKLQSNLKVDEDYITIAGQTAPGDGICLRDYCFTVSADHVIVRFIRSRLGADGGQESDAMSITSGNNIIMDHCSASWSVDEVFSCSTGDRDDIDNVTVQWSIISEGLGQSIHDKGYHSYGALIRGCYGAKYSYHHNLFAHNNGRNPRPGNYDRNPHTADPLGLQFDFRNNVVYNWGGSRPSYDADTDSACRMNYVANYCKAGPSSSYGVIYDTGSKHFKGYFEGNYFKGTIPSDQYSLVDFGNWNATEINSWIQSDPFSTGPIVTQTAQDAYADVLANVGASLARDEIDTRITNEVLTGTATYNGSVSGKPGIIDDESDVGGWPEYNSTTPPSDSDRDGMPDAWETANGLNPNYPGDRNYYDFDPGYTNLEIYLNGIVAHLITDDSTPAEEVTIRIDPVVSSRTAGGEDADTNKSDSSKLSVRASSYGAKSWIKFDLAGLDVTTLNSAILTLSLHEGKDGSQDFDVSAVNDDYLDNIGWLENDITWNNAPGNDTSSLAHLNASRTAYITNVEFTDGLAGDSFDIDVLAILQADTDGIVQIVLHNSSGLLQFATHDHTTQAWQPFITAVVTDDSVDMIDFAALSKYWLSDCNAANNWCQGMDYDKLNGININDLYEFLSRWIDEPYY